MHRARAKRLDWKWTGLNICREAAVSAPEFFFLLLLLLLFACLLSSFFFFGSVSLSEPLAALARSLSPHPLRTAHLAGSGCGCGSGSSGANSSNSDDDDDDDDDDELRQQWRRWPVIHDDPRRIGSK